MLIGKGPAAAPVVHITTVAIQSLALPGTSSAFTLPQADPGIIWHTQDSTITHVTRAGLEDFFGDLAATDLGWIIAGGVTLCLGVLAVKAVLGSSQTALGVPSFEGFIFRHPLLGLVRYKTTAALKTADEMVRENQKEKAFSLLQSYGIWLTALDGPRIPRVAESAFVIAAANYLDNPNKENGAGIHHTLLHRLRDSTLHSKITFDEVTATAAEFFDLRLSHAQMEIEDTFLVGLIENLRAAEDKLSAH